MTFHQTIRMDMAMGKSFHPENTWKQSVNLCAWADVHCPWIRRIWYWQWLDVKKTRDRDDKLFSCRNLKGNLYQSLDFTVHHGWLVLATAQNSCLRAHWGCNHWVEVPVNRGRREQRALTGSYLKATFSKPSFSGSMLNCQAVFVFVNSDDWNSGLWACLQYWSIDT